MENIEVIEQNEKIFKILDELVEMSSDIESITVKLEGHQEGREHILEDILFYRSNIDYLIEERMVSLKDITGLRLSIKSLINECIKSSLEYVGTDREEIERLGHLLR